MLTLKLISMFLPDSHSWQRRLLTSHRTCFCCCYDDKGNKFHCVSHALCSISLSTTASLTEPKLAEESSHRLTNVLRWRQTVSPHKERRGAASRQHDRFLSAIVCLPSTRQHNTREGGRCLMATAGRCFRWRQREEMSTFSVYITANCT